ncbi:MAG: ATP-binding protein [Candidatus Bathyarchaeota archaeon]|nr:ATP-binding protein [Candidatus Bathyarchaeota archaeon]
MIVTVASGKGGTGKTSVAVNLALSVGNVQLLDCDVEEPNAHLFLNPAVDKTQPVYTQIPHINEDLCTHCAACSKFCQFNALFVAPETVMVFPELCHSCGGCALVCPTNAITYDSHRIGTLKFASAEDGLELVYGELEVGKPMAVPVIKAVKAQMSQSCAVIIDSPPGTSCPFVETARESDFCVLVTEPTPFGLHDLTIAVTVLQKMTVPFGVVVNRAGIGDRKVYEYCKKERIPVLMEIPYKREIAELYSKGIPFSSQMPQWKQNFQDLFTQIREITEK